jgi:hypothetical protein
VYVDKPNALVWFYEWSEPDQLFFLRDGSPETLDKMKARVLRDDPDWDVRSAEEEVSHGYAKHSDS